MSELNLAQTLLDGRDPGLMTVIRIITMKDSAVIISDLGTVFDHSRPLGISAGYLPNGQLASLAISDDKNCRIIEFQSTEENGRRTRGNAKPPKVSDSSLKGRAILRDRILCRSTSDLFAFDMAPLAMALYRSVGLPITRAVDIQSAFPDTVDRRPLTSIKEALKGSEEGVKKIKEDNIKGVFQRTVFDPEDNPRDRVTDLAQRAWISQFLATFMNGELTFEKVRRIKTEGMQTKQLEMISKIANDSLRLDSGKPVKTTHRVVQTVDPTTGDVRLDSQSYSNKLRANTDKELTLNVMGPRGQFTVNSTVAAVSGRAGYINAGPVDRRLTEKVITTVTSVGRDDPTKAEAQRAATVLALLQGPEAMFDTNPWIQNIWFSREDETSLIWPKEWTVTQAAQAMKQPVSQPRPPSQPSSSQTIKPKHTLNPSQQEAVNTMLSDADDHRITIIQGPPGTGKTSVIASFVNFHVNFFGKRGTWLVAQSNVAVKNIAEKLISTGFQNWRILVSKDFHFDWHEHLYGKISDHIVRSDKFHESTGKAKLKDVHVILCTLSMLSNANISKFMQHIPFKTLVVDEASQIEIGDYISVFINFKSLRKACFIGDDKQLPPHGQENLQDLESIFEISHLKNHVIFLNIQYRMPPQIGDVISKAVYDNKLKSNSLHPITDKVTACYFIDVDKGKEQQLNQGSFKNIDECDAVLKLAEKLQNQGKGYRIITPYDAQTKYIEECMQTRGLIWADKCFNVDSFQGNEEDYIIISVVRSRNIGFLSNLRRTNVMLSRCKKGMFIVSSHQFLTGAGKDTLIGKFLEELKPVKWLNLCNFEAEMF